MRSNMLSVGAAAALCFLLGACGIPVPPEKSSYVGEWTGPGVQMLIQPNGRVTYKRVADNVTTSINAPLQKFEGDNFSVGLSFFSTTFVVSRAPYQQGGAWKMVVDGNELTRIR